MPRILHIDANTSLYIVMKQINKTLKDVFFIVLTVQIHDKADNLFLCLVSNIKLVNVFCVISKTYVYVTRAFIVYYLVGIMVKIK